MLYALLLYASLADPVFETRESATSRLTQLVDRHPRIYGPMLARWTAAATCPEVRSRGLAVLRVYDRWRVNSYAPPTAWPICDAFPVANPLVPFCVAPDLRCRSTWPVERLGAGGGPAWPAYRRTTERRVRELIRQGMTHEAADRLVLRMWELEVLAKSDCGTVFSGR